ncbi:hypothetical protein IWX78_001137 [Mycetocola sp. CAN_C7]|uniref:aggregation-promoting factor C-terminal-like domain-containing protein n=1 Tax=Mycetocola sp. CAN_C7 TaxID=2787724 RepID=UPI0018CAEFFB
MLTSRHTITRSTKIAAAVAAAGILVAGLFTAQANAVHAETGAQLSETLTGINGTLSEKTGAITEAHADQLAESTIAEANAVVAATKEKVDTTPLSASVASLADYRTLEPETVVVLASYTGAKAEKITAEAAEADRIAAVKAAERAAAAAEKLRAGNTPDGARATAASLASSGYGWGSGEFSCLNQLWQKESGWSYTAYNASSGATGIPQALPGSKMATAGSDWKTNAATQIAWGLDYIDRVYGSPCSAWSHSQAVNWY